ncbi:MAG: hypothetical protein AAGA30_07830, partial [Planctomycetota bacterium]
KQDGFARALGLENSILTERETWDFDVLKKTIAERIDKRLNLKDRFQRPSVSMERFGSWVQDKFSISG